MRRFVFRFTLGIILLLLPVGLVAAQPRLLGSVVLFWIIPVSVLLIWFCCRPIAGLLRVMEKLGEENANGESVRDSIFKANINRLRNVIEDLEQRTLQAESGREHIQSIIFTMVEGIIATDASGRISFMNPAAENLFDLAPGAAIGKFPREIWREYDMAEIFHLVFVKGEPEEREIQLEPPSKLLLKVQVIPIRMEGDVEVQGVLAVLRDLTRIRHLETVRSEFVANVSHELRTPLTSIKGFVETLLDGGLNSPDSARRFLQIIGQETDRLNRIINDLLDLSRLESGRTDLYTAKLFLAPLVEDIHQTMDGRINEKNLNFSVELGCVAVWADEDRLREVLVNLIDNAIKYTPEGGAIRVRENDAGDFQEFMVCDTGIGIPKESIGRIFERFYRVDKARSRELGGTGLGLSIVKHIIDRHGGRVWVESEYGKGTCFHFTLPKYREDKAEDHL
ncbi:MAG TPA: ATP-binding protein [Bacillota bacterium]|nr:ATP-binding protein [Bacillota bacterium]